MPERLIVMIAGCRLPGAPRDIPQLGESSRCPSPEAARYTPLTRGYCTKHGLCVADCAEGHEVRIARTGRASSAVRVLEAGELRCAPRARRRSIQVAYTDGARRRAEPQVRRRQGHHRVREVQEAIFFVESVEAAKRGGRFFPGSGTRTLQCWLARVACPWCRQASDLLSQGEGTS
jgi:hypothetical protein